jgi:hypothetical protein
MSESTMPSWPRLLGKSSPRSVPCGTPNSQARCGDSPRYRTELSRRSPQSRVGRSSPGSPRYSRRGDHRRHRLEETFGCAEPRTTGRGKSKPSSLRSWPMKPKLCAAGLAVAAQVARHRRHRPPPLQQGADLHGFLLCEACAGTPAVLVRHRHRGGSPAFLDYPVVRVLTSGVGNFVDRRWGIDLIPVRVSTYPRGVVIL